MMICEHHTAGNKEEIPYKESVCVYEESEQDVRLLPRIYLA